MSYSPLQAYFLQEIFPSIFNHSWSYSFQLIPIVLNTSFSTKLYNDLDFSLNLFEDVNLIVYRIVHILFIQNREGHSVKHIEAPKVCSQGMEKIAAP